MKLRIKDKRKFNRFLLITMILVLLLTYTFIAINSSITEGKSLITESVIVGRGETLWSIAANLESSRDIREIIYDIKKLNKINNATIFPGQKLLLPQY